MSVQRRWIDDSWEIAQRRSNVWRQLSGSQLFVGSFIFLVLFGATGLKVLPGLYTGEPLSWVDAIFTAVSAVCVTGLIVVDTATYFTIWGQAWILLLIQLGGLGMITFSTLIILALGRRLSLRQERFTTGTALVAPHVDYRALARDIVKFTFLLEAAGALLLYLLWVPEMGPVTGLWHAAFHAISAFCNAGFSTFSTSLIEFQQSPLTLLVIMLLIVAGGLGFLTLEELHLLRKARGTRKRFRLSLHSRIVLATTAVLIFGGAILLTVVEWSVTFADMPLWARPLNGLFMSVTARTAGFNAVDYAAVSSAGAFLTVILMSIGGSPGSTAGGMKTTTFALIGLLAWSRFRGKEVTSIWGRSVPEETVQRAVGLFTVVFGFVTLAILGYVAAETWSTPYVDAPIGFLPYMFEASSAFNTVGLSMGVTPQLSLFGKWLTIFLMFVGRVGPLTFAAAIALARRRPEGEFRFAYENVVVG